MTRKKQTLFDNTANPSPENLRKQYKSLYDKYCKMETELKLMRCEILSLRNALDTAVYAAKNNQLTEDMINVLIKFL